jgi:hypothetical protein
MASHGHPEGVDEEEGIYRGEVRAMMVSLADIYVNTETILAILRGEDEEDDEEEKEES